MMNNYVFICCWLIKYMIIYYLNGIEVNRLNLNDLSVVLFLILDDCMVIVIWGNLLGNLIYYFYLC